MLEIEQLATLSAIWRENIQANMEGCFDTSGLSLVTHNQDIKPGKKDFCFSQIVFEKTVGKVGCITFIEIGLKGTVIPTMKETLNWMCGYLNGGEMGIELIYLV